MRDPRTPSELLACFLLADEPRAHACAVAMDARNLWSNAIPLAMRWRTVPRLSARTRHLGLSLPASVAHELHSSAAAVAAQSTLVCHRVAHALAALADAGVRAAAFKGVAAIATVHRSAGTRMLSDADVLIRPEDFKATVAALAHCGFHPDIDIALDDWHTVLEERVYRAHDFLDLIDSEGVKIDLHWRVNTPTREALAIDDLLARARAATLSRRQVLVVATEDAVLLTVHHAVREGLAAHSVVKDLLDVAAWVGDAYARCEPEVLLERARDCGLDLSLAAVLQILSRYAPGSAAAALAHDAQARLARHDRQRAERLAELFFLQLERGNASELLVGLSGVTPALLRRFVVSRVRSIASRTYRKHKYTGQAPPPVSRQLRFFLRDIVTLTPRRLATYRALSRERKRYADAGDADVVERSALGRR